RYAIKECSSCGTLYTKNCACSIGTVEDKILVSKPPKNYAQCTRCGYLVDGSHCQGCALLRQEFEEILVTHSLDFHNTSKPSNASTSVVNAPREPYVVKQDNGSFVDEIIFDLNRAPDSPNQFLCFHCKDVLRDGEACKRCTCVKCGSGLSKGLCYICGHNQNSLNNSPRISETSLQSPPNINHCCYECGDPLDGIFCKRCTCKSCGKDAHTGYNCPSKVPKQEEKRIEEEQAAKAQYWKLPVCYDDDDDEEGYNSLNDNIISELPPYSAVIPTEPIDSLSMGDQHLDTIPAMESDKFIKACVENLEKSPDLFSHMGLEAFHPSAECPVIINGKNIPLITLFLNFLRMLQSHLITCSSTEEPDNSLSMGDEHLDTIPATESDEFIKSGVENLIPIPSESEGILDHVCDVSFHDNSPPLDVSKDQIEDLSESTKEFSSTDDDSLSLDNIDYVEASPPDSELVSLEIDAFLAVEDESTSSQIPKSYLDLEGDMLLFEALLNDDHSSDFKTKSSSTSLNSLLEETNNFYNSLPEFTTFSNVLCDAECKSDSSDDQSCFDEDVLEKIVLKPLCEEEIIPMESLRTHDSSLPISSKIDSFLDEFAGELTLLKLIPPRNYEADCDFEEDIRLIEKLLYDNSSPRLPEEFLSANSEAKTESFSPSPILVKDSDSLMEELDLFCTPDYPMPPGIVDEDYDSERDILIPKNLPSNNSFSFAEKESFHFDIPLFSRPPAKPPDGDT
nr:hypothetical protein [Tanacetum cinerariifolium]